MASSYRYRLDGKWFKGNTHIHSVVSDGGKDFSELAQLYAGMGYDFLFRTDHWVVSDVASDTVEYPLLWLDGVELDGEDHSRSAYHVVCLGTFTGINQGRGLVYAVEAARAQGGLIIMAHPHWMGNTAEDALRLGFDGVEIYNHICNWLNGKGDGAVHWDAMLERFPQTLSMAVDDAHITAEFPGWNGGWVMVNAAELSRNALMEALRAGNFYSTCGPQFLAIFYEDNCVTVRTSPVRFIRLVGPGSHGQRVGSFDGQTLTEASFEIPPNWSYTYIELEDEYGRRAWTNTLFI